MFPNSNDQRLTNNGIRHTKCEQLLIHKENFLIIIKVVRWSALATGVLYGAVHLRSVKNIQAKEEEHQADKHHQELIQKARKAWDEKTASQSKSSNGCE